jgi:DNA-binding response OmpR family regulator
MPRSPGASSERAPERISHRSSALDGLVRDGDRVLVVGLAALGDDAWAVLEESGLRVLHVLDTAAAVEVVTAGEAQIVVTDARHGPSLIRAVRGRSELVATHVVVGVDLDSPSELVEALDSGADDVLRIPFARRPRRP